MRAKHYLMHLAKAYAFYHPIDEHKRFTESSDYFERKQLRQTLSKKLESMEKRAHSVLTERASERTYNLMLKIRSLRDKVDEI